MSSSLRARFDTKYVRTSCGCWIWVAAISSGMGYGKINTGNRTCEKAHRVSWILHNGIIPEGSNVLHKCDVPCCVNPEHLFLGSKAENNADKARKGRGLKKLSIGDANLIRAAVGTHQSIADLFGVSRTMVTHIKNWKQGKFQ